jgi:hypothetical protein
VKQTPEPSAGAAKLLLRPSRWDRRGAELTVEVEVQAGSVTEVWLHYRSPGETDYRTVSMKRVKENLYKAVLRGKELRDRLDCYVEGMDGSAIVSGVGGKDRPSSLGVPRKKRPEDVNVPVSF